MQYKDILINGISLVSKRWNITLIPESIPAKRGENVSVPYLDGRRFVKKNYDERREILNMYVLPFDESGMVPAGKTIRQQLEENIEYLKWLFGSSGRLLEYRKKMIDDTWRKAYVEVTSVIQFDRKTEGSNYRIFSVELLFPEPFFYDETETSDIVSPDQSTYSFVHNNKGTAMAKKMSIELSGGLINPKIINETMGVWFQVNQSITAGTTVTLDTEKFEVTDNNGNNLIHTIIHSGDPIWMIFASGDKSLKVICDSTPNGTITFKYNAHYF